MNCSQMLRKKVRNAKYNLIFFKSYVRPIPVKMKGTRVSNKRQILRSVYSIALMIIYIFIKVIKTSDLPKTNSTTIVAYSHKTKEVARSPVKIIWSRKLAQNHSRNHGPNPGTSNYWIVMERIISSILHCHT